MTEEQTFSSGRSINSADIPMGPHQIKRARTSPTSKAAEEPWGDHSQRSAPRKITRATLK